MTNAVETRKLLEFDRVLDLVKQFAISPLAEESLDAIEFLTSKPAVETGLKQVSEFRDILDHDQPFPLQDIWDIREELELTGMEGQFLNVTSLIRIVQNLSTCRRVRHYLKERQSDYVELWQIVEPAHLFKSIEQEVEDKLDFKESEVKDSASPKLKSIRKQISQTEQQVRKAVDALFKTYSNKGYLQEDLVTLKDGRLVFPVKAEHRGRVKGLVHDQSASGATLFVEPYESIELNNEISGLRAGETREIERILRELTTLVRAERDGIQENMQILTVVDVIQAKTRFSKKLHCASPAISDRGVLEIAHGRHPLLMVREQRKNEVVPLDLKMGDSFRTLVITGPNAGGKTVALKTMGLFALMVQSGLPIPADPDSKLPVFNHVFADIGDFQSIENDLSTFSSHMSKTKMILENATAESLVLIDEIGVGTDPDEGAALAVAVLEELTHRGCMTLVTTHHGALKTFAYDTPGVENGSMEFDIETLEPVYRFRAGIPGSSYALEISKRLGIAQQVLSRAKELIGSEKSKLETLILELERKLQESQKVSEQLQLEKSRLEGLTNLYKERYESIKRDEKKLKEQALKESRDILKNTNAVIERTIKEIRETQAEHNAIREAKQRIAEEKSKIDTTFEKLKRDPSPPEQQHEKADMRVGENVFWQQQNKVGTIVAIQDGSDKALVQVENFKFWVPGNELFKSQKTAESPKPRGSVKIQTSEKSDVLPEIDLRGQTLDEAVANVDKFLDDALLAGWQKVRIIHGKGTGVLRKGIADFLGDHARVKSKRMGAWNEGDIGVTEVELA